MGMDVNIYFSSEKTDPIWEWDLPRGFSIEKIEDDGYVPEGATHKIKSLARYYSENYARGPWTDICTTLMLLHACPDIKKVWYGSDSDDIPPECSIGRVNELSEFFMRNGNRTYTERR